jgi:hypothetical protein
MKRLKRILIFILILSAVFLGGAVIVWFTIIPNLIEDKILSFLHEAGHPEATIEVEEVTFTKMKLKNLKIGNTNQLNVSQIEVTYSFSSIKKGNVQAVILNGATSELTIKDRNIKWIEFSGFWDWDAERSSPLPFDSLKIHNSNLHVSWEGDDYYLPINFELEKTETDSLVCKLQSSIKNASLSTHISLDMTSLNGNGAFRIDSLSPDLLENFVNKHKLKHKVESGGYLDVIGKISVQDSVWFTDLKIVGDLLSIGTTLNNKTLTYGLKILDVNVNYASNHIAKFSANCLLNRAPLSLNGLFNFATFNGNLNIDIRDLDAEELNKYASAYFPDQTFEGMGRLSAKANISFQNNTGTGKSIVSGKNLSLSIEKFDHMLHFSQPDIETDFKFTLDSSGIHEINGTIIINGLNIADQSKGLNIKNSSWCLPFDWENKEIKAGSFKAENIGCKQYQIPLIAGSINVNEKRLQIDMSGNILPEASFITSGWFDFSKEGLMGKFDFEIPRFTLENGGKFAKQFAILNCDDLGGSFLVRAHLNLVNGELEPWINLRLDSVTWVNNSSETKIIGLTGNLVANNLEPFKTDGEQTVTIKSVSSGSVEATNGKIIFNIEEPESINIKSFEFEWAGGKLFGKGFKINLAENSTDLVLVVEKLDLQRILDFLEYDGVRAAGWIFGDLHLGITWGNRKRISFGNGLLEARPQNGRLELSKETAMKVLGMREKIDQATTGHNDEVKLMILRALQDMEYTKLKAVFKNEPNTGLVTRVQIQGHGPYGEMENQIPIGGLDINLYHLNDLINSIIFEKIQLSR